MVPCCASTVLRVERVEVVHPLHGDHVRPALPRLAVGDDRDVVGLFDRRVLGAVDEAGEVTAVEVDEAGLLERERGDRSERGRDAAGDVELDVFAGAVGPHPDVVLRGRRGVAGTLDGLERPRVGGHVVGAESPPELGAEADDDVRSAGGDRRLAQPADGGADGRVGGVGAEIELQVVVRTRALGEDAGLRDCHRYSSS